MLTETERRAGVRELITASGLPNAPPVIQRGGRDPAADARRRVETCVICAEPDPVVSYFWPGSVVAARRRATPRAEVRQLLQSLAFDLESASVRAFLDRVDRLYRLGWTSKRSHDVQCALAHTAPYGLAIGASYVSASGDDRAELRRRSTEVAPHLGLEPYARGAANEADAWLRRRLERLP